MDSNIEVFYIQIGNSPGQVPFLKKMINPMELPNVVNLIGPQASVIGIYSPSRNEFTITQEDIKAIPTLFTFILLHYRDLTIVSKLGRFSSEDIREKMKSNAAVDDILKELNIKKS